MKGFLNILNQKSEENLSIIKIENKSSFIDLEQLKNILPLKNAINNEEIFNSIYEKKSLLLSNEIFVFII